MHIKPNHARRYQFGLKKLLVALAIVCVLLALLLSRVRSTMEVMLAISYLRQHGAIVYTDSNYFVDRFLWNPPILYVDISGSQITDDDLANLKVLPKLTHVYIKSAPITDCAVQYLVTLTNLQELSIEQTMMTETGIEVIRHGLPQCDIKFNVSVPPTGGVN